MRSSARASLFQPILEASDDVDLPLPAPIKALHQHPGVRIHGAFGRIHLRHLSLEGGPAHPLGLVDEVPNSAVRSESAPEFEGAAESAIARRFPLASVGQVIGFPRCEATGTVRLVEFRDEITALGRHNPLKV